MTYRQSDCQKRAGCQAEKESSNYKVAQTKMRIL